jgi:Ca2+-transporting ATPase
VFAGTLVVQGDALAWVRATGMNSELGRIGAALGHIRPPRGRLQREIGVLARRMAVLGLGISLLLVLVIGLRGVPGCRPCLRAWRCRCRYCPKSSLSC